MPGIAPAHSGAYLTHDGASYATCAQPMLWSPDKPLNYSHQTQVTFADISPRHGVLTSGECYNCDFGVDPGPHTTRELEHELMRTVPS